MAIVFLRTLIVYISLLITLRLMGKRQLGEWSCPNSSSRH